MNTRELSGLGGLAAYIPLALCLAIIPVTTQSAIPVTDEGTAEYIVRTERIETAQRAQYLDCLKRREYPFWKGQRAAHHIDSSSVFETDKVLTSGPDTPHWNFLLLVHVSRASSPKSVMDQYDEQFSHESRCEQPPNASLLRLEFMRTAPNANYAGDSRVSRKAAAQWIVEYIAVNETPEAMARYRDNMRDSVGPALKILIQHGHQLNFVGLETVAVPFSAPGMVSWNNIHIGRYSTAFSDEQDEAAMDAALRSVNPGSGGYAGVFGPLPTYRSKPREDQVQLIEALSVRKRRAARTWTGAALSAWRLGQHLIPALCDSVRLLLFRGEEALPVCFYTGHRTASRYHAVRVAQGLRPDFVRCSRAAGRRAWRACAAA